MYEESYNAFLAFEHYEENLISANDHDVRVLYFCIWIAYNLIVLWCNLPLQADDLFRKLQLVPSDTDFRIYRDFGLKRGLDMAVFRKGFEYLIEILRCFLLCPLLSLCKLLYVLCFSDALFTLVLIL